jgi:hypothetical protein
LVCVSLVNGQTRTYVVSQRHHTDHCLRLTHARWRQALTKLQRCWHQRRELRRCVHDDRAAQRRARRAGL